MKDFLNFNITVLPDGPGVRYTIRHKKHDLSLDFPAGQRIAPENMPAFLKGVIKAWTHKYTKTTRKALSPKQKKFYDALVWFYKTEGRPPSHEEMCDLIGWKSKGTSFHFTERLLNAGWLWQDEEGRNIPIDIAAPDMTD